MKTKKSKTSIGTIVALLILAPFLSFFSTGCAATASRESTGEYVDDASITTKVKADLIGDDTVKAHQITVETYKGVVQLSGFVDTSEQKDRAAEIAKNVPGVQDVTNNIIVKPSS
jgi:hyperosmotically inducible protein